MHPGGAGLLWAINGGRLVELHRDWAVIELAANGSRRVFERRRVDMAKVTLPWIERGYSHSRNGVRLVPLFKDAHEDVPPGASSAARRVYRLALLPSGPYRRGPRCAGTNPGSSVRRTSALPPRPIAEKCAWSVAVPRERAIHCGGGGVGRLAVRQERIRLLL
jgi:hypothetical protein